jgi:molybdopterin synthase catalytic subunit/molybdopterin converting factor small subunit
MVVEVRLFAVLKERAGRGSVEVDLSDNATVADALEALSVLPGLDVLARMHVTMAVNRVYATLETPLAPEDELALIPPVSGGGRDPVHATVTGAPLSLDALVRHVTDPSAGAIVVFQGLPRDLPALEYEAYSEMARQRLASILLDCVQRHGLTAAAAEHRVGRVPRLEPSVIVAASAPHRAEAFAGAREAIDRIKAEAPIWKVEVGVDGGVTRVEGVVPQ